MLQRTEHHAQPDLRLARRILVIITAVLSIALTTAAAVRSASPGEQAPSNNATDTPLRLIALAGIEKTESPSVSGALPAAEKLPEAQPDPERLPRLMWMEVTAYCACKKCCGPNAKGITASGKDVSYNNGRFVAADTDVLPFGSKLSIPGYHDGEIVEVIDRGGAIKGNRLDLYFPTHEAALQWGRQWVAVTVY
jgi:3D (Asp-Asp-Asp) domain-containing protein